MITLKTLPQATAQEIFDQVAIHLLKQNQRSCREIDGVCVYRNSYGLKCAAGCLIGDDEYTPAFEDNTWGGLEDMNLVPSNHNDLIVQLQRIHDNCDPRIWNVRLAELAFQYGLTMPESVTQ